MSTGRIRPILVNGGTITRRPDDVLRLELPATATGYTNAQLDDGAGPRRAFPWRPGTSLQVTARFSHGSDRLLGTAGFGFWNAPFGDRSGRLPALPQAAWFFYASPPNDLPLATDDGPGRGWFAATLDATRRRALALAPLTLPVLLLNQVRATRRRVWPAVQARLGISFARLDHDVTAWHRYGLRWTAQGTTFAVDDRVVLATPHAPRGPLTFVCWIDNQYLIATPRGRLRAGTLSTAVPQWLDIAGLTLEPL